MDKENLKHHDFRRSAWQLIVFFWEGFLHISHFFQANPHHLNMPNPPRTTINYMETKVGRSLLEGLFLLCCLATLIVEEILVEFLVTKKKSTSNFNLTNMEMDARRI